MMDFSPLINQALSVLWWVMGAILVIAFFRAPVLKGMFGESLVRFSAKLRLPEDVYHPLHNVTLPVAGGTTQVDHIFVSQYGIFVVETKNMKGWIFGGANQAQWTQKLFKKTFKFQNPLRQNYKHTKALEAVLGVAPDVIHSVVVFAGDSTFKTPMPANVTKGGGYVRYIKSFSTEVLTAAEVRDALARIHAARLEPGRATHREHVRGLKSREQSSPKQDCPKCGAAMVLRTAKRGTNAGNQFWGCSSYPKCRTVERAN